MKVGTDSVLLGCWTPLATPKKILDIGAGTGILALLLAQRNETAEIDAVEIQADFFQECEENVANSPWKDRISCFNEDISSFAERNSAKYDLIISNPPFFTEKTFSKDEKRALARFTQALSFEKLLQIVRKLLSEDGFFSVIIPYKEEKVFCELAQDNLLFPKEVLRVRGNASSEIKRSLLLFSSEKNEKIVASELCIELSRHKYTPEYNKLTENFYLKREK